MSAKQQQPVHHFLYPRPLASTEARRYSDEAWVMFSRHRGVNKAIGSCNTKSEALQRLANWGIKDVVVLTMRHEKEARRMALEDLAQIEYVERGQ